LNILISGDKVLSYCKDTNKYYITTVKELTSINHCNLVKYILDDESEIITTQDHPFLLSKKGWASISPEISKQYKGFEKIEKIELGDEFIKISNTGEIKTSKLKCIEHIDGMNETYKLEDGNSFIANGFIVGTKELSNIP
jgi:hypothetical protein